MSTQIAVRLPDEIVTFIDAEIAEAKAKSRAEFVLRALERERRRTLALRDAMILNKTKNTPDDLDSLVTWTTQNIEIED